MATQDLVKKRLTLLEFRPSPGTCQHQHSRKRTLDPRTENEYRGFFGAAKLAAFSAIDCWINRDYKLLVVAIIGPTSAACRYNRRAIPRPTNTPRSSWRRAQHIPMHELPTDSFSLTTGWLIQLRHKHTHVSIRIYTNILLLNLMLKLDVDDANSIA
jgi:hypothetical protein